LFFSRDKSGTISSTEIKSLFEALEIGATDEEVLKMVKIMDVDGDGEISFVKLFILF
jgi:hypothetical protein